MFRRNVSPASGAMPKHLWIRIALFQKSLSKIVDYLVENAELVFYTIIFFVHPLFELFIVIQVKIYQDTMYV